jgi:hypothetical protein
LVQKSAETVENVFVTPSHTLRPGETFTLDYLLYFGPKTRYPKAVDHQLAWASTLAFTLLPGPHVLKFFYSSSAIMALPSYY